MRCEALGLRETKRRRDEGTEGLKGEGGMGRREEGEKTPHNECYLLDLLRVTPSLTPSYSVVNFFLNSDCLPG